MSDLRPEPEGTVLQGTEQLARAVLTKRWFNSITKALKPDAFEPPPGNQLSVTRHIFGDEPTIWGRCRRVAELQQKNLHGRADLGVEAVENSGSGMSAVAAPREHDPGHAHVIGWPDGEDTLKGVMLSLAAAATFVPLETRPS
jgi:hypothetical protein